MDLKEFLDIVLGFLTIGIFLMVMFRITTKGKPRCPFCGGFDFKKTFTAGNIDCFRCLDCGVVFREEKEEKQC